jgi:hypothetical protein
MISVPNNVSRLPGHVNRPNTLLMHHIVNVSTSMLTVSLVKHIGSINTV